MGVSRGRLQVGLVLAATLALVLALSGVAFLAAPGALAIAPFSFSDCVGTNDADLQGALSAGRSIQYTGSAPCTIAIRDGMEIPGGDSIDISGGVGLTLDGGHRDFYLIGLVSPAVGTTLSLEHVTLENASNGVYEPTQQASVTLTDSLIRGLSATSAEESRYGIGIGAAGNSVTLVNSTIDGISVTANGTRQGGEGIGVSGNSVTLINSTIKNISVTARGNDDNSSWGHSYGIFARDSVSLTNSEINGISATARGNANSSQSHADSYGIWSIDGPVTLSNSTVSNIESTASGHGSLSRSQGVLVGRSHSEATATLSNSTISGISTDLSDGDSTSASRNVGIGAPRISLTSSTIDGMSSTGSAGTVSVSEGVVAVTTTSVVTMTATILANADVNCDFRASSLTDGGYNLSDDRTCGFSAATSLPNRGRPTPPATSALHLQPLGNYGGPTRTIALGEGSIAVDRIPLNGQGQCAVGTQSDQRGTARPVGSRCDVGAFEGTGSNIILVLPPRTLMPPRFLRPWFPLPNWLFRIAIQSPKGVNISNWQLKVKTAELDGPNGEVIPFNRQLSFIPSFHIGKIDIQPSYLLILNTRKLAKGDWTMVVQVGSGKAAKKGWIAFTVK